MSDDRRAARRQQGAAAVMSETDAAALLPCRDDDAREWLRERGLVRNVAGIGRCVIWGDVLEALRQVDEPVEPPAKPSGYPRVTLRGQRKRDGR